MRVVKEGMESIGLKWKKEKCGVAHVRRGSMKIDDLKPIRSLGEENTYKFLGVLESVKRENNYALENAAGPYLQRLSINWSSPRSDQHKVVASDQYVLPPLTYLMWAQVWPLADLQQLDREEGKIVSENVGKHPQGSLAMIYLSRKCGEGGMKSVKREYKNTMIKTAVKLFSNPDQGMAAVRSFEEKEVQSGLHSIIKDAQTYA